LDGVLCVKDGGPEKFLAMIAALMAADLSDSHVSIQQSMRSCRPRAGAPTATQHGTEPRCSRALGRQHGKLRCKLDHVLIRKTVHVVVTLC
jgi:hypothetical protein